MIKVLIYLVRFNLYLKCISSVFVKEINEEVMGALEDGVYT